MKYTITKLLSLFGVLLLVVNLHTSFAARGGARDEDSDADTEETSSLEGLKTTLTDKVTDSDPVGEKNHFEKDTAVIYLTFKCKKSDDKHVLKTVWIADDTNGVAPANYKVAESEDLDITDAGTDADGFWKGKFKLTKPNSNWPAGKYHVDLYDNGEVIKSVKYSVP